MFEKLKGIEPGREVMTSGELPEIQKLYAVTESAVKKHRSFEKENNGFLNLPVSVLSTVYEETQDLDFTERDLTGLIRLYSCMDSATEGEARTVGAVTGALLTVLVDRNRQHGKATFFQIDGCGLTFDYLFYGAARVDRLAVTGFRGTGICEAIGQSLGEVDSILIRDCEGVDIGSSIAMQTGSAHRVVAIGNKGDGLFEGFALRGKADYVFAVGNQTEARKRLVNDPYSGIRLLLDVDNKGYIPDSFSSGHVGELISYNSSEHPGIRRSYIGRSIVGEEGLKACPAREQALLRQMISTARAMPGQENAEVFRSAEQIETLYEKLKECRKDAR